MSPEKSLGRQAGASATPELITCGIECIGVVVKNGVGIVEWNGVGICSCVDTTACSSNVIQKTVRRSIRYHGRTKHPEHIGPARLFLDLVRAALTALNLFRE